MQGGKRGCRVVQIKRKGGGVLKRVMRRSARWWDDVGMGGSDMTGSLHN